MLPAASVAVAVSDVRTVFQGACREAPGSIATSRGRADRSGSVIDRDRAVRLGRSGHLHLVGIDHGVADQDGGARRMRVDGDRRRRRCSAGLTRNRVGRGQAMLSIVQRRGGVAPRTVAADRGRAKLGGAVEHRDGAAGHRGPGHGDGVVVGGVIARGDNRYVRSRRLARRRSWGAAAGRLVIYRQQSSSGAIDIPRYNRHIAELGL